MSRTKTLLVMGSVAILLLLLASTTLIAQSTSVVTGLDRGTDKNSPGIRPMAA